MTLRSLRTFDPSRLYLLPLGVGNAFTRLSYNASFLMIAGERNILVDCPAPIRRVLYEAGKKAGLSIDLDDIDDIILTHLHGDHCNGLEEVGFYRHHVLHAPAPNLYLLPEVEQPLWEHRLKAAMAGRDGDRTLESFFNVHVWEEGTDHLLAGTELPWCFRIRRSLHSLPCFGFVATFGDVQLGYSGDSEFEDAHVEFLRDADFIIHEAGDVYPHTEVASLEQLPDNIRRKIHLIHTPDYLMEKDKTPSLPILEVGRVYEVMKG